MSAVEEIRLKVEQRLHELELEIASLRSALTALDEQEAAARTGVAASPPATSRRRRASGRPADAPSSARSPELERMLAETGGMDAVELARQTGTDYAQVLARIRELELAARRARDAA